MIRFTKIDTKYLTQEIVFFNLLKNKTLLQTIFSFSAQIFGMGIMFIANILMAKTMGPESYGLYSFAFAVLSFVAIFFEFGYFASGSRLLATVENDKEEKDLLGALLIVAAGISLAFVVSILLLSLVIDFFFSNHVSYILQISSVTSFSFILPLFMNLITRGTNHIENFASFNFLWKVLFILSVGLLYYYNALVPVFILLVYSGTLLAAFLVLFFRLSPSFNEMKYNIKKLNKENKIFGIKSYIGRVIDVSTFHLDKILISYFIDMQSIGFYSLAFSMASPISTFSKSLASSKFKSFKDGEPISKKMLLFNLAWVVIGICIILGIGWGIVYLYLGVAYHDVFYLIILLVIAVSLNSAFQPYNAWLNCNGYGRFLRQKSVFTAPINIILNFIFIPLWGAGGAAFATILSYLASLYLQVYYYHVALKEIEDQKRMT